MLKKDWTVHWEIDNYSTLNIEHNWEDFITIFRPIAMLCGTDNIMRNVPRIQAECEEYST